MTEIRIDRQTYEGVQTTGKGYVLDDTGVVFEFSTLELPWKNNKKYVSCIPPGRYTVVRRYSEKYRKHFHVLAVKGRSYILIHHGNYYSDTLGCILPGRSLADIDGDGYRDVTHSVQTMNVLNDLMPDTFEMVITEPTKLQT